MLKIVKASLVIAATLGVSGVAQADVSEALANICTIVQADDKGELRKKMRRVQSDFKLKLRDYYSGVTCGGQSLIRTALTNNAVEVGTLLVKKMPSMMLHGSKQLNFRLLFQALDAAIPPTIMWIILTILTLVVSFIAAIFNGFYWSAVIGLCISVFALAIVCV